MNGRTIHSIIRSFLILFNYNFYLKRDLCELEICICVYDTESFIHISFYIIVKVRQGEKIEKPEQFLFFMNTPDNG